MVIIEKRDKNFVRADERYQLNWAPTPKTVEIGEYKVPMPILPSDKLLKNLELKEKKQKYQREVVPDMRKWKQFEIDEFVKAQWHRRRNGEWHMIKGEPYFFPGGCIPFFDNWKLESGRRPDFRYSALTLFQLFYNFVLLNPNIFGIYILKTRRIGDTANVIYMIWEQITSHFGVRGGIQSYNDQMARKTYRRLAKGAAAMPFYFKPNRTGSDGEFLAYMALRDIITMKKLKEKDFKELLEKQQEDEEFLGSYIDSQPTVEGAYDGEQLFAFMMDEILKFPVNRMNATTQLNNLKRCISLFGEDFIFGKGFALSTVEKKEKKTAKATENIQTSLEMGRELWEGSDPAMLTDSPDKRTLTGFVRIFRGYQMGAKPDEWGFPQVERATKLRTAKLQKALQYDRKDLVLDIYRKEPATPDEALLDTDENCPLYPEICQTRLSQIDNGLDKYNNPIPDYKPPYTEGILQWRNNIPNSEVIFIPQKGGPWHISQIPTYTNQVEVRDVTMRDSMGNIVTRPAYVPKGGALYRGGCDPISSNPVIVTPGSKMGIVIKRRFNPEAEKYKLEIDPMTGLVSNPDEMETNQFVADYVHRPYTPTLAFMEVIKAAWFYSCPFMIEMDKPELMVYLRDNGYAGFIMYEPPVIRKMRNRTKNSYLPGVRSQGDVVGLGVTSLKTWIAQYWMLCNHPRLLRDWSRFDPRKRTKYDATVATYMAEIGDMDDRYTLPDALNTGEDWSYKPEYSYGY